MMGKQISLIRLLLEKNDVITAACLSVKLRISVRSVKNYVNELNWEYPNIIITSHQGYRINPSVATKALSSLCKRIPQTTKERAQFIIVKAVQGNRPLEREELCEELFISDSTLQNVLLRIKKRLENFDLHLLSNSETIEVVGTERNKRYLLSSILYDESNANFFSLDHIQDTFLDIDIGFIKESILNILHEYRYFINDYSLTSLVLHIAITIDRIQNKYIALYENVELYKLDENEYNLTKKLAALLENNFNIEFCEAEINEMALLVFSRITVLDYTDINIENLKDYVGDDCCNLVMKLVNEIRTDYGISLTEPNFLNRFAIHIRNLLTRANNKCFSKNPLTDNIKQTCPFIYEVAVQLSGTIREDTGIFINDDEIAYIAFHLGYAIEIQKQIDSRLQAIIYCPAYYDMNTKLYESIAKHFENELLVISVITEERQLQNLTSADLIIATVPLNLITDITKVIVQPFLTGQDYTAINQKIAALKKEKQRRTFEKYIKKIIKPEFFERRNDLLTREAVVHYLCECFRASGYVDENFEKDILDRESLSSTAYSDFAIPHALKMRAKHSGIRILLSDKPILWGEQRVQLIIMLCFNNADKRIFNEIFEPIAMALTDVGNVKKALSCNTYEEFVNLLIQCI